MFSNPEYHLKRCNEKQISNETFYFKTNDSFPDGLNFAKKRMLQK